VISPRTCVVGCLSIVLVSVMLTAAEQPPLLLLDASRVAAARTSVRAHQAGVGAALAALEQQAAKALKLPVQSVMDKGLAPPSGDKHDYMSQAPYWWPDPAKPNGKPYIRRDGERNPELDRLSDHDAIADLTSAVSTLGLAYALTGRDDYATHAARLVRVWFLDPATRMNPHLRYGQGIPGVNDGRGIGIIETRTLPQLLDAITLIAGSPAWTAADQAGLQAWMHAFLTWLVDSPYGQDEAKNGNNHETWYNAQVASLALWTGQPDIARKFTARGRDGIAGQIEPGGKQPRETERTRGWHYSIFNLTAFFNLATVESHLAETHPGDAKAGAGLWTYRTPDGRSLRQAIDYLVPFAAGDRKWPAELDEFKPASLAPLLRRAAIVWQEPKYAALAARLDPNHAGFDLTLAEP
jgi:hypothetical protein